MQKNQETNDPFYQTMLNVYTPGYINFKEFTEEHILFNIDEYVDDIYDTVHVHLNITGNDVHHNSSEERLRHNINYLYRAVEFAFLERFLKDPYIVDELYKCYIKPYLSVDIRTQRKQITDTITLDNFMGAIGAAFLKYVNSDNFSTDMSWFVDKCVLFSVDNMKYEDDDYSSSQFYKYIFPNIPSEYNMKDITYFSKKIIVELIKIAFVNHFDWVFAYMIKRSKRYKALKPYIDNIDILMNANVPSLYGSCNTLDGYVSQLTDLQNETADDVSTRCVGIIDGVGNIIKPLLNIVDSSGYPWRLRYDSILALKSDNYTEEIKTKLESELESCRKAMVVEMESYREKLSNCYGFDLVDHIYQLFDSKLTSTRYFDVSLYIQNKRRQFLNGGEYK